MKIPQSGFYPFGFWNGTQEESGIIHQLNEIAGLFVRSAQEFSALLNFLGKQEDAKAVENNMKEMIDAVKRFGRDAN